MRKQAGSRGQIVPAANQILGTVISSTRVLAVELKKLRELHLLASMIVLFSRRLSTLL